MLSILQATPFETSPHAHHPQLSPHRSATPLQRERRALTFKPTLQKLATIHASICRLRPHYILALRVVLSYAISRLDYLYDAIPPPSPGPLSVQLAVNNTLTAALGIPRSFPKTLLYAPLSTGGFGFPHLNHRFQLRFIAGVLRALNSRNALVRNSQALPSRLHEFNTQKRLCSHLHAQTRAPLFVTSHK